MSHLGNQYFLGWRLSEYVKEHILFLVYVRKMSYLCIRKIKTIQQWVYTRIISQQRSALKLSAPLVIKDLSRSPISKHFVVKIARINFGIAP